MNIDGSYNNFARGKIDHDMNSRYDLPVFQTGCDLIENFITNFKGNAIFRTGFESIELFEDCVFVEFKFNNQQQYLCLFYANTIRFMSYDVNGDFGYVLDGGAAILEVTTPYTLAQCRLIQYSQNDDDMIVTVKGVEPYKLNRVSANSFTFLTYARKLDPFPLTYQASKVITAITQATNAQISVAAHGYVVGDRVRILAVVGMTQINTYVARVMTTPTAGTFTVDIDTTTFTAYGSAGTTEKVLTGDYPKCCLFYKARLYYGATPIKITTVWASVTGSYYDHTATPVTVTTALTFTIADISQEIEWLFPGDNSLVVGASDGIVVVNGGGVNEPITAESIEATLTSAEPCNSAYPVKKDGLVMYVGVDGRNLYYFQYDILKEAFQGSDANFLSYDITIGGLQKIRYKKDRNNLIVGTTGGNKDLLTCNFKQEENIIGWHDHPTDADFLDIAVITNNDGKPQLFALVLRDGDYFIERQGEYIEFKQLVKFFSGKTDEDKRNDYIAYNRYIAEQLKECIYVDSATVFNNLQSNLITYDPLGGTITATTPVFSLSDEDKHIVYKTETGYESGRFLITNYVSTTVVEVSVLQEPTQNTYTDWYLTFSTLSGLTNYNDKTVSVVADGGYLDDFLVSSNSIDFGKQITSVVIGYKYKGIVKSFSLGFQVQTVNTQTTMKNIAGFGVRCVASAGLEVGSSLYKTESVQELSQNDINYLPPIPIDGTKFVPFSDSTEIDKFFYIIQDLPLPANVTGIVLTTSYGLNR
jgi:hypothetical protein